MDRDPSAKSDSSESDEVPTYRLQTVEVHGRRNGSVRADIDSLEVHNVTQSGLRASYVVSEDDPVYEVSTHPVTDGDSVDVEDADHVVATDQFVVAFEEISE